MNEQEQTVNDTLLSTKPLNEIGIKAHGEDALARELGERFENGREQEVIAFIQQCDRYVLKQLVHVEREHAVWRRSSQLWLRFFRLTAPRHIQFPEPYPDARQRDAAFSHELRAICTTLIAAAAAGSGAGSLEEAATFVLDNIIELLPYDGMPRDEALSLLAWNQELRALNGTAQEDFDRNRTRLMRCLSDPADLLAYASQHERYFDDAIVLHRHRSDALPRRERWLAWHDFFHLHPERFDKHQQDIGDPALIVWRWPQATPELRRAMAETLLGTLYRSDKGDQAVFLKAIDQLMADNQALFATLMVERSYLFSGKIATLIWQKQHPGLLPALLPTILESYHSLDGYRDTLRPMLSGQPELALTIPGASMEKIIPLLTTDIVRTLLPVLGTVIAKSTSKALGAAMVKAAKKLAIDDIAGSGWLAVRNKNLRKVCKDILQAHPDKAGAAPLLASLEAAEAGAAAVVAARAPAPAGPFTSELERIEFEASVIKRLSVAIAQVDNPETLALFQPLSNHAARTALHLAATSSDALPPLATDLLAQLSPENRARLSQRLAETWIGNDGEPKMRWMLRLAASGADDRIVDLLSATVFAWGKTRKQRAVVAVEQLELIDSPYALARVLEISESRKVKGMVVDAAAYALRAAAARRKLSLGDLLDELTPDFGLGQGITLTVGAQSYQVVLQGDLSLRLVDAKGKASKSLPANKEDSLKEAWEAAASQFKILSASLKAVAKLQAPRMLAAFVTARSWTASRWTQLFLDHPLLKIMGRSLIWQTDGASGVSFRIAEDFSLLQANDEVVTLPPDAHVTLWHPATARAGEIAAWRSNFADYELTPLIDQTGAPAELPPAASMTAERLLAPAALKVFQEHYAAIASKCGYRQGPVGDGPSIDWHEWPLPAAQLEVRLENGFCSPFMDLGTPIEVHGIAVRALGGGYKLVAPASLPKALLATLWSHLQLLEAKRVA
ncbi:DUF4132 domain-containing protein [Massilia sp. CCM 8733]|uniref:DUF4132 domain-containing protein n=1 Tax=Massilia mucilaginosa TaxID=2609282 RepID=A0ABX0NW68_9BURK|nr:DUF4132 domain-containing protein [Massilia mucilaginosa]NHZ91021.1 DUF4132 domain-containing protein [Massilia mucilaginosa]